jgi:hypothetical protein
MVQPGENTLTEDIAYLKGDTLSSGTFVFFLYGASAHIGPWPPLMRFLNLTLIDSW